MKWLVEIETEFNREELIASLDILEGVGIRRISGLVPTDDVRENDYSDSIGYDLPC